MAWVFGGKEYTRGDVIEWTQSIFDERWRGRGRKRHKELITTGKVRLIGQFEHDAGEWLFFEVREVEIVEDYSHGRMRLVVPDVGDQIRRARSTVEKGRPRRLRWRDGEFSAEVVRARVVVERRKKIKVRKPRKKGLSADFSRVNRTRKGPKRDR